MCCCFISFFFFFKQKTAYEMRISDWSSDVCSSDLDPGGERGRLVGGDRRRRLPDGAVYVPIGGEHADETGLGLELAGDLPGFARGDHHLVPAQQVGAQDCRLLLVELEERSEEQTSELQSLMRN